MDLTLVDATGSAPRRGDRVVCLGSDGGARVTRVGPRPRRRHGSLRDPLRYRSRVPRVYSDGVKFLESIGRAVLRLFEELGRFFQMLGQTAALGGPAALRRAGALPTDGAGRRRLDSRRLPDDALHRHGHGARAIRNEVKAGNKPHNRSSARTIPVKSVVRKTTGTELTPTRAIWRRRSRTS